ncbi:amidohydrolase family protein [Paracandidimonas soli]|uniref:Putative TIM-barrel fold metal-dependent hydrolase n=1 Tax=Paracandidimonas soli TaxID=1917182 RepID=A0A4R3US33_9BURK|nr:amidohydrolase family protein [Paracandidimonas soli]TCU93902.1 putative TIM-barrel fold metal-dependent hydrolase [Paracandidimonas soli]
MNSPTSPFSIPPDACDCHVHVFLPEQFPYATSRSYTPPAATIGELLELRRRLGTGRTVLVQPSCYGTDNAAMLSALAALGTGAARGIAVIDPASITDEALRHLHDSGVRGLRLNLRVQPEDAGGLDRIVRLCRQSSDRIRPLGWHLQLHLDAALLARLASMLEALNVPLVLDHFGGGASAVDLVSDLLLAGNTWVKLSAPYRVSTQPEYADLARATQRYLSLASEKLLWASDWPHTGGNGVRNADSQAIEPFRREDALQALARLARWAGDSARLHAILVDNPAQLYGFQPSTASSKGVLS